MYLKESIRMLWNFLTITILVAGCEEHADAGGP